MEPLDQSKVMHLQPPFPPSLDLSTNFKKSHTSSKSRKASAKKSAYHNLGSAVQSPLGFSDVTTEQRISQCHPQLPVQNVYSKPNLKSPCYASPHFTSHQSRFNGHPSASSPSSVYSYSADLLKRRDVGGHSFVNNDQAVGHPSFKPQRFDLQNGHKGYSPTQQLDRKTAVASTNYKTCQAMSSFNMTKIASHGGYKAAVESRIGASFNLLPQHSPSRGPITSPRRKATGRSCEQVITEIKRTPSPEYVDSDDSDIIEVPLSNCVKNTQSSPNACQHVSAHDRGRTRQGDPNVRITESGEDAIGAQTSDYSTSGVVASQNVMSLSSSASFSEDRGELDRVTGAYGQSRPKQEPQQPIESPSCSRPKGSPGKAASGAGAIPPAKRRRKKQRRQGPGPSSSGLLPPQEPEIKLKYASQGQKEERRDGGGSSRAVDGSGFCPYVRVDQLREFPLCTVVNCQEEDEAMQQAKRKKNKGHQQGAASAQLAAGVVQAAGAVPSTSCLRLGRLSAESRGRPTQTCSLCGWPGNSMGLGDLHGPYVPSEPVAAVASASSSKHNPGGPLHQRDVPWERASTVRAGAGPGSLLQNSPMNPSKRARIDWTMESANKDTSERWIHEDCSIWSAGIFLIKGRLYGLEEAIRIAEETECSCCYKVGATLGCVFKGCCNKYHYTCALQTDCLLSEENFSMRCPKHKNKTSRLVTR